MRLKSLTTLNTLLLIAVCLALGATLWWSERAMERPYLLMVRYLALSQQFQQQAVDNIHGYLASGDALRHSQAQQALTEFADDSSALPEDLAARLRPSLAELSRFTADELLAAGKLAGDPQGLLLQAEREMAGVLSQLDDYRAHADHPRAADYQRPLFAAGQQLFRLSHARGKLVSSGRDELNSEVEQLLRSLEQEAARLDTLPLLGVLTQNQSATSTFAALQDSLRAGHAADFAARVPDIVASETTLLGARQGDFISKRDGAEQVLEQAQKELDILEKMLAMEVAPLIEVTAARKQKSEAENRLNDVITQMELDRATTYSDTLGKLTSLRQQLKTAQDQLDRTVLMAPMKGVVNKLSITTIGGVVRPGEEILQIIPLEDELYIEARVRPEDIASVRKDQDATIKLTAYDYTIYGTLQGKVDFISADTFKDERARNPDGDPHYKVTVKVDLSQLTERQQALEIRPGMLADVELQTGGKTILTYLTKPLYKSNEAFRER